MLEILLVMFLTRKIGSMAEANGRNPTGFKVLAAVMWFGGEFMGAIVGAIIAAIAGGSVDPPLLVIYPFALAGAALGAGSAFLIVHLMGPVATTSTSSVPPSFPKIG